MPESMRWDGHRTRSTRGSSGAPATAIIAWVDANGGEARYEPGATEFNGLAASQGRNAITQRAPRIVVRTASGGWAYAEPGDTVVMGSKLFLDNENRPPPAGRLLCEFTVRERGAVVTGLTRAKLIETLEDVICDCHEPHVRGDCLAASEALDAVLPLIADAIEAAPIPFTRDRERMEWGHGVQVVMAEVIRGLLEADDDH